VSGTVITFYSYKGGVGRTQALANVGTLLSGWGYRVLCVDWDLEAPGLHRYFDRWLSVHDSEGLVELITEHGAGKETDWRRRIQRISFPQESADRATLDFLSAGRFDEGYVERLQALNWEALYRERHFGEWIEALRADWKEEYDFVLIDSRTGITDLGGICTIQLPDILVLLFTASHQSLDGVLDVARRASERQGHLPFDRSSLPCVPIPTRFEGRVELEIAKEWLETFATRLDPLYRAWLAKGVEPRQLLDVLRLPSVPYWSFGEKMPVLDEGVREPESLGYALATLAALLAHELDQTEVLVTNRDDFVEAARGRDLVELTRSSIAEEDVDVGAVDTELHRAYLSSVVARTQPVPLSAIVPSVVTDGDRWLSVEAIYTPLLTIAPEDGRVTSRFLSAVAQLNLHPRLVLLGEPGSGKSTFARFLALCMAGETLDLPGANLRRLASSIPESSAQEEEAWDHGALLPVWISLRDFAARGLPASGERTTAQQLWSYIEEDLNATGLGEYSPLLRRHLLSQGGLLILDGLDEVPEAESRREQVRQSIESFVRSFDRCRVLVTCRTYAYQNQGWRLPGFAEAVLAPFDEDQINHFIHRWFARAAALDLLRPEDAAERADRLLRGILGSDRLRELAEQPLLLSLMPSLFEWRGGNLPERREELYAEVVELLLYTWEVRRVTLVAGTSIDGRSSLDEFLKIGPEPVLAALQELAYEAHAQAGALGTGDIAQSRLIERLLKSSRTPELRPALLIDYLQGRAGLLEPRGMGVYAFTHRAIQEYLAACYLMMSESFPDQLAELARADPLRWQEVALLAGARVARGVSSAVWPLAEALCWREPEDPEAGIEDAWGALIAGQLVTESADLERISRPNRVKLDRTRRWLVRLLHEDRRLPAAERCLAGRSLANLGDPRPEVTTVDGMAFCQVPAGPFQMGSAYPGELPAHIVEIPHGFWIGRFPVTVAQYREFAEASGYAPAEPTCLQGRQNHPVVLVSWQDALTFCTWLTKRWREAGRLQATESVMLPSEAEWEKAACGYEHRPYTWGKKEPDTKRANFAATRIGGASTVGCFPAGASPFGCEEMCGNVWEWTRSLWGRRWEEPDYAYPYDPQDGREDLGAPPDVLRILRGGSYISPSRDIRCSFRTGSPPDSRNDGTGFRVVLVPSVSA